MTNVVDFQAVGNLKVMDFYESTSRHEMKL